MNMIVTNIFKPTKFLLTAALLALVGAATAATYTQVFSQDFEDANTYTANFYSGDVKNAIFGTGTGEHMSAAPGTTTWTNRTDGTHFYSNNRPAKSSSNVATYLFNDTVKALTSYKLEFDYYNSPAVGPTAKNSGLSINGPDDVVIATINYAGDGGKNSNLSYGGKIYKGDDATAQIATYTTSPRGTDPATTAYPGYWMHVTITANECGVRMSVKQANETVVLSDELISNSFIALDSLYFRVAYTENSIQVKFFGVDNILVCSGTPTTFVWTGDAQDSTWSTPGNWTVDGVAQTESYPAFGDIVSGLNDDVLKAMDVAVKLSTDNRIVATGSKSEYVWTGAGDNQLWSNATNWNYASVGVPAYEAPGNTTTATFPASFTEGVDVLLSGNVGSDGQSPDRIKIVLDTDVKITSDNSKNARWIYFNSITGSGKLSTSGVYFQTQTYAKADMSIGVEVLKPASGLLITYFKARGGNARIFWNGAITGDGTLRLAGDNGNSQQIYGDMSGFTGTLDVDYTTYMYTSGTAGMKALDLSGAKVDIAKDVGLYMNSDVTNYELKVGALTGTAAGLLVNNTTGDFTLEVGSNGDDASAATILSNGTNGTWTVRKVGSNVQTLTDVTKTNGVDLVSGKLNLPVGVVLSRVQQENGVIQFTIPGDWTNGTSHVLFTSLADMTGDAMKAAVSLEMNAFDRAYAPTFDTTEANVLKVSFTPASVTWIGASGADWNDSANWQITGTTLAPGRAPGANDTVIVGADKVVAVEPDQSIGTITLGSGSKLAVKVSQAGAVAFTLPSGLSGDDVMATGPFTLAYDAETGFTATRVPSSFIWIGADGNWSDRANWQVNSVSTEVLPNGDDAVRFPASRGDLTVTMNAEGKATNVWTGAALTLTGGNALKSNLFDGPGSLVLSNALIGARISANMAISNTIEIVENTVNEITLAAKYDCNVCSNLTGKGTLKWYPQGSDAPGDWNGLVLYGDCSQFEGTFEQSGGWGGRSGTCASYTSSNAVWKCDFRSRDNTASLIPATSYFGAIIGAIQCGNGDKTITVGHRDDLDSTFTIVNRTTGGGYSQGFNVIKEGAAKLTLPAMSNSNNASHPNSGLKSLTIKRGTVEIPQLADLADDRPSYITFAGEGATLMATPYEVTVDEATVTTVADPSDCIKNSTSAIVYDSNGTDATWTNVLDSSNEGGLVKKGAGTLTLSEVPAYSGLTTVEEGKLVVPADAAITLNVASAGEFEGGVAAYGFEPNTTNVWNGAAIEVPNNKPLDLANLAAVDISGYTDTMNRSTVIVIAEATGGFIGSPSDIEILPKNTYNGIKFTVQIKGNQLVVACRYPPLYIHVR